MTSLCACPCYCLRLAGCATLRGPWQGTVHSVFTKAVNVTVGQTLFTFVTNQDWVAEHVIVIEAPLLQQLHVGDAVAFDGTHILLNAVPVACTAHARAWHMPCVAPTTLHALPLLATLLATLPRPCFADHIEPAFITAAHNFWAGKPADFSKVIGVGAGLTPSGDDMLVGFALAVWYRSPKRLAGLHASCARLLAGTTDISRHLLHNALHGKFTAPLVGLLVALASNSGVQRAATTAIHIGSSSGRDGVFGLYHGLLLR